MTTQTIIILIGVAIALIPIGALLVKKSFNFTPKKAFSLFVAGCISLLASLILLLGSTGALLAPVCPTCKIHLYSNYCATCGHEFYQERDKGNECAVCHNHLNKEAKYCKVCGAER